MDVTKALVRLALIGGGVVFGLFVLLFALRQIGLNQEYALHDHPLLKHDTYFFYRDGNLSNRPDSLDLSLVQDGSALIHWVDLRISKDNHLFLYSTPDLEDFTTGVGPIEFLTNREIQNAFYPDGVSVQSLNDFLNAKKNRYFLINVLERNQKRLKGLRAFLATGEHFERLIITSPYTHVLRAIKKDFPRFLYLNDPGYLTKLAVMEGLYLEPLMNIWPDFLLTASSSKLGRTLNKRVIAEAQRQKKKVIVDLSDRTSLDDLQGLENVDGYLTDRPKELYRALSRPASR